MAAAASLMGAASAGTPTAVTVLTQNVSLGVPVSRLLTARSLDDVRRITGELLDRVEPTLYQARAAAIAAEIAETEAAVVALQEVAVLRTQRPGDFGSDSAEPASNVVIDLLTAIESSLEDRGLDYEVAAETVTNDLELPAADEEGPIDVRITNRNVLLVRGDLETDPAQTGTYDATLRFPLPGGGIELRRGYCTADVTVGDVQFTAVSTHLESISGSIRRQQARELLDLLPTDRPVLLCGDFNSGPGAETATYEALTASFDDPFQTLRPEASAFTCCQAADLRNRRSMLDRRIDGILVRGAERATAIRRVGHRPSDRITARVDGTTVEVWPSDHAGVVGTFEFGPTTPAASTTDTSPEPTHESTAVGPATETAGESGAGFGLGAALGGVAGALYLLTNRLRDD